MIVALELSPEAADTARLIVGLAIPIAVGLFTKSTASSGLKATTNTVLAALSTALMAIIDGGNADVNDIIRDFIQTSVTSYASYYGIWKPTGVAGTVAAKTARFGIGSPPAPELTTDDKGLEELQAPPAVVEAISDAPGAAADIAPLAAPAAKKATTKKAAAKKAPAKKRPDPGKRTS